MNILSSGVDDPREVSTLRFTLEETAKEVAVMQEAIKRIDKALWGNGQPGIIAEMQNKLITHDKLIWVGLGILTAINFLTGSGVISLKAFLGK